MGLSLLSCKTYLKFWPRHEEGPAPNTESENGWGAHGREGLFFTGSFSSGSHEAYRPKFCTAYSLPSAPMAMPMPTDVARGSSRFVR